MLKGLLCLVLAQAAGEAATYSLGIPLPGAVVGMLLLLIIFSLSSTTSDALTPSANVLLKNFALFLIPIGPSLLLLGDVWRESGFQILVVVVLATLLTLVMTAGTYVLVSRLMSRRQGRAD